MLSVFRIVFIVSTLVIFRSLDAEAGFFKPSRENICRSVLKAQHRTSHFFSGVQIYTINSIKAITQAIRAEERPLKLHNGYAHFRSKEVLDGSLNLAQVKTRLQAIMDPQLHARDKSLREGAEDLRTKTVAVTLVDSSLKDIFFQTFNDEIEKSLNAQTKALPLSVLTKSLVPFLYSAIMAAALKDGNADTLALLPLTYALLNGSKGIRDSLPGSHSSGRAIEKLNQFAESQSTSDGKDYFLFSNSAPLGEYNLQDIAINDLQQPETGSLNSQLDIINSSMPLTGFSLFNQEKWIHFDLLVERQPNGESEVHLLLQFTEKEPQFPKRNNKDKKDSLPSLSWEEEPQLVPIPISTKD